jgi:hypothetical protein
MRIRKSPHGCLFTIVAFVIMMGLAQYSVEYWVSYTTGRNFDWPWPVYVLAPLVGVGEIAVPVGIATWILDITGVLHNPQYHEGIPRWEPPPNESGTVHRPFGTAALRT